MVKNNGAEPVFSISTISYTTTLNFLLQLSDIY